MYQNIAICSTNDSTIKNSPRTALTENGLSHPENYINRYSPYISHFQSSTAALSHGTLRNLKPNNTHFDLISAVQSNDVLINTSPLGNECLIVDETCSNNVAAGGMDTTSMVEQLALDYNTSPLSLTSTDVSEPLALLPLATPQGSTIPQLIFHESITPYTAQHPSLGLYGGYQFSDSIVADEPTWRAASTGSIFLMQNNQIGQYSTPIMGKDSFRTSSVEFNNLGKPIPKHNRSSMFSLQVPGYQCSVPFMHPTLLSPLPTASIDGQFISMKNYIPGPYFESVPIRNLSCDESIESLESGPPLSISIAELSRGNMNKQSHMIHYTINPTLSPTKMVPNPTPMMFPIPTPILNHVDFLELKQEPQMIVGAGCQPMAVVPQHLQQEEQQTQYCPSIYYSHENLPQREVDQESKSTLPVSFNILGCLNNSSIMLTQMTMAMAENSTKTEMKTRNKNDGVAAITDVEEINNKSESYDENGDEDNDDDENDNHDDSSIKAMSNSLENNKRSFQQMSEPGDNNVFINFTQIDAGILMSGVAPSGSMKTKARREAEARKKRGKLASVAATAAVTAISAINS